MKNELVDNKIELLSNITTTWRIISIQTMVVQFLRQCRKDLILLMELS